jgi:tRNA1Val (adenine37-N6)-methyltransferase
MGRDYFQFKQFLVNQKRSAMRVGTDGVLLGAWVAMPPLPAYMLDIGTGTGLMALMLAQRCSQALIHGVEADVDAYEEACGNFAQSRWSQRLKAIHSTFQQYALSAVVKYDLIVCNPPFFSGGMKNSCSRKALARHNDALGHEAILKGSEALMARDGQLGLILPAKEYYDFQMLAARRGWFEQQRTLVRPTPQKNVKRVLSLWGLQMNEGLRVDELIVEEGFRNYSSGFRALTSEFYLEPELKEGV